MRGKHPGKVGSGAGPGDNNLKPTGHRRPGIFHHPVRQPVRRSNFQLVGNTEQLKRFDGPPDVRQISVASDYDPHHGQPHPALKNLKTQAG
jgi:hypothetical protein